MVWKVGGGIMQHRELAITVFIVCFSRLHNMDSGTSYIHTSILNMRTAAVNSTSTPINNRTATFTSDRGMYVDMNGHSRALHAFRLAQPRGTLQFDGDPLSSSTTSSILAGCMDPSYSPSLSGMSLRCDNDQHMMVNGVNQSSNQFAAPPTRVPITSTVTSLEYPARPANPHRPDLNCFSPLRTSHTSFRDFFTGPFTSSPSRTSRSTSILNTVTFTPQGQGDSGVKVKTEPIDCDGDVTSSGLISYYERERGGGFGVGMCPERPRRDAFNSSSQIRYRPYETVVSHSMDQGDEVGDASHVSQSSEAGSNENRAGSFMTGERGRSSVVADRGHSSVEDRDVSVNRHHHLLALIKTETSSVAVQCSGRSSSCFKSEVSAPTVTVAAAEHSTEATQGDGRQATEERGIQCELIASPPRRLSHSRLSTDSEQHSMSGCDSRCPHCGITFEDEVLFTIHIGCHSHTDPFVCNVCGKKCGNKYGFYSHITRGHHL
jgi:IKAROS family zinc finger protein